LEEDPESNSMKPYESKNKDKLSKIVEGLIVCWNRAINRRSRNEENKISEIWNSNTMQNERIDKEKLFHYDYCKM